MADQSTPIAHDDVDRFLEAVAARAPTLGIRIEVINHLREQRQQLAEMARREEAARAEADAARADAVATRQKADEAVKALAESEQRYRYMGETIPFGVWWCNPKGEAEYVSPSFCELLDMTLEEQQKFGWTKRLVPEDVEPMMTKWLHCCETGTPWDHEHRIIDRHGEIHTVLSRGLPVRNDSGQIIAFVGVNLDITDRKRIELQLEKANKALEQALRAKDQFVANISHELRTPLTLIIGPVERHAAAANLTDEQRRDLGVVERNARTLLKHVNDLLDLSKLEVGEMHPHYAEGDMARLGRLVASYFEVLAEERHIRYSVHMPESLPAQFNPEQLQRILLNLLSNAFKFTPDGGSVTLSVRAEEASAVFTVEDSGPGVPAEHREAIFERFRQVDGSTTRRHGGTGLGLAIVKEFVRLHHGDVKVYDAPAGGASFTVRIPLTAPADVEVEPSAELDEEMARYAADELRTYVGDRFPRSSPPNAALVLVVEDNREMNAFLADALSRDYRVVTAFDGREGLERALAARPDLIVTDVMMPEMSGEDLVRAVRRHKEMNDTRILVVTAKADDEMRVRLLKGGAQDSLAKPFATEELLARAGALIAQKRQAEQSVRESYALLKAVTEGIDDAVFVKDRDGRYLMINTAGARYIGRPVEEIIGREDAALVSPEVAQIVEDRDRTVMTEGRAITYEHTARLGGGARTLLITKAPRIGDDGRIVGLLGISRDITGQKAAEDDLRKAKEVAEEASRAKDHLLAVVSHELRTPLTPVLMATSVLARQSTSLSPEAARAVDVIQRNVEREARLIDDLLDLTRITRGVSLHQEVVDVHACLRTVREICQNEIDEKGLALSADLRAKQHAIWADPQRLQQVFWNVLRNAIKFTPAGGRIDIRTSNDETGRLRVSIRDTGIGIRPEAMRTIFHTFEQGEKTVTRKYGGLGLGLAIAKMLIDLHRGASITAESDGDDRGATFTMEFDTLGFERQDGSRPSVPAMRLVTSSAPKPLRLLLVEDHPDSRDMLALQLESAGYRVATAATVGEALELAGRGGFDLLISDIGLPDGSGLEVMHQVKERYGLRGIALSGFGTDEDVLKSKAAGFEHHVTKPVNFQTLQDIIERLAS